MIFAPHILQKKVIVPLQEDEYGRLIPGSGGESWKDVCKCRCDDNTTKEFTSPNGSVYRPSFHIICDGKVELEAGDEIRCLHEGLEMGNGKIFNLRKTNYFGYTELWI